MQASRDEARRGERRCAQRRSRLRPADRVVAGAPGAETALVENPKGAPVA